MKENLAYSTKKQSFNNMALTISDFKAEIVRKSLHFLIALSPPLAAISRPFTVVLLMAGVLAYTLMEKLRLSGIKVPLVSSLTNIAARERDKGYFVMGPVTLGFGALFALVLFPSPAAAIAIFALAFGDGFASLIGKFFGQTRPAFMQGKSIEGSLACFIAVLLVSYGVIPDIRIALAAAFAATAAEALPLGDYDNLALPVIVGFVVQQAYV